jgi:hypothetical protein
MRFIPVASIALIVCLAATARAQDWTEYVDTEAGFSVNFPGSPQVKDITWTSEYGLTFAGRVYSASRRGAEQYSVTVIDYRDAEQKYHAVDRPPSFEQAIYWQIDIQASIQYAATKLFRQRQGVKVHYDAWHYIDLVEGHMLHLTNADQSVTHASIYLHENRLYILEGTVPPSAPEPGLFTQSLGFLDANGQRVRYREIYSNRLPPRTMGNRIGGGRGRGQGPAQGQPQP